MRKTFFTVFVIALVAVFFVTQCGLAQRTLRYWTEYTNDPQYGATEELIKKFMNENPDIKIKHRPIENEQFHTVVRTGFTGGDPPEICQLEGFEYVIRYAKAGQLVNTNDWLDEYGDRFIPGLDAAVRWKDDYYGIPCGGYLVAQIYYNGAYLDKYGISVPTTWLEFVVSCQILKGNNEIPIAMGDKHGWPGVQWFTDLFVRFAGAQKMWDLAMRVPGNSWTDPDVVQAASFYQDLNDFGFFPQGKASDDYPAAMALFLSGKTAYFHTGSWFVGTYSQMAPPDFDFGLMKFPVIAGGKGPDQTSMGSDTIVLTTSLGEDTEPGFRFLDFMSRKENAEIWVKRTQGLSSVKGAVNEQSAGKYLTQLADIMAASTGSFPHMGHMLPAPLGHGGPLYVGTIAVLTGEHDAQSWMEWLEAEAQKYEPVLE